MPPGSPAALPGWLRPAILALAAVLLLACFSTEVADSDTWLHLETGKYVVEHHRIPNPDPFSFTTYLGKALPIGAFVPFRPKRAGIGTAGDRRGLRTGRAENPQFQQRCCSSVAGQPGFQGVAQLITQPAGHMAPLAEGLLQRRQGLGNLGKAVSPDDPQGGGKNLAGAVVQNDQHGGLVRCVRPRFNPGNNATNSCISTISTP